jgi:hypothetical protein
MPSSLKVDQISTTDGSVTVTTNNLAFRHYAEFAYASNGSGGDITVAANNSSTKVPFTRVVYNNGIVGDIANSQWTHTQAGVYKLLLTYRQNSGTDIWVQYAVRNNTSSGYVGTSVRCGSVNSSHPSVWEFTYNVDALGATYSLMGWANGTITVLQNFSGVSSAWSGTTSDIVKIIIYRLT